MIEFEVTMPDFGEISDRGVTRALKAAGNEAAGWFLEERLMLRFTDPTIQRELGYADRISEYVERKMRIKKRRAYHNYSGESRGIALRGAKVRVTKKFLGVKIPGLGPQYGRRKKGSTRIDMRAELQVMSRREMKRFAKIYGAAMTRALQVEIDRHGRRRRT